MWKLLEWIFVGHSHEWEIYKELRVKDHEGHGWTRYHLRCKHCGNMKFVDSCY